MDIGRLTLLSLRSTISGTHLISQNTQAFPIPYTLSIPYTLYTPIPYTIHYTLIALLYLHPMTKSPYTYLGILISYFSITGLNLLFKTFYGDQLDDGPMLAKELIIFGMVGLLFWIILKKENTFP